MGELVSNFTKLLTDLLEQNDKRHNDLRSLQDAQGKLIDEMKGRLIKLEISNQQLSEHNDKLETSNKQLSERNDRLEISFQQLSERNDKLEILNQQLSERSDKVEISNNQLRERNERLEKEFSTAKQREHERAKEFDILKTELGSQKSRLAELTGWVQLINPIASQVNNLDKENDVIKKDLMHHHEVLGDLARKVKQSQQQSAYTPSRVPVKSASATSSFFNGNTHNSHSQPRVKTPIYLRNKPYLEPYDPNEEISEIDDETKNLMRGIEELTDLHRSFEKSSFCSDE